MTANEMTDNEIIKEFEKEIKYVKENEKYNYFNPIVDIDLCEDVLNIMKLQNAEIERLKKDCTDIDKFARDICKERVLNGNAIASFEDLQTYIKKQKSEAIKEFAEEFEYFVLNEGIEVVEPKCKDYESYINGVNQFRYQIKNYINNVLKEMTKVELNKRKEDERNEKEIYMVKK